MNLKTVRLTATVALLSCAIPSVSHAAQNRRDRVKAVVDRQIRPLMAKYNIPGMAVGIVDEGHPYVFDYGMASIETGKPVARGTLFEIGSVSKTFTATLASYAQIQGHLSLSDKTGKYLPALHHSQFGEQVNLLNLGTHTPGGLPLQVPDNVHNNDQLMQYFKAWRPACPPGTCRTYTNIGIGTLGLITAKSMGQNFTALMQQRLFPALGLKHTYIDIPQAEMADYAQGYTEKGTPIRMAPGVLYAEAYGIRTTAADMLRFVEANMNLAHLNGKFQSAVTDTHTGYFQAGGMTQDLIWEQYPYPVELKTLLEGNSPRMIFRATPVTKISPPEKPRQDVWIDKTGSTNGFGAYVAFVSEKKLGIVILANKSFPIEDRVTLAYNIFHALIAGTQ